MLFSEDRRFFQNANLFTLLPYQVYSHCLQQNAQEWGTRPFLSYLRPMSQAHFAYRDSSICSNPADILVVPTQTCVVFLCLCPGTCSLASQRVNSHSDPLSLGMDMQLLHNGPILRGCVITLCCYTNAPHSYVLDGPVCLSLSS